MSCPVRCVVDTNVAVTSNDVDPSAGPSCVLSSAKALQAIMERGHLFIDDAGQIVDEYRANLSPKGQPGPGDAFLKWVLTNEWAELRVTRVPLTVKPGDPTDFLELPAPTGGVRYDPSDRKFLAVAAAHAEHPPVLQALDSKWWGWVASLKEAGVSIHFLCPQIAQKHAAKMK
jgi:hypothetical protein